MNVNTYEVVYVNIMSLTGKPARIRVKSPSNGSAALLRAVEKETGLAWGSVQLLEARQI